MPRLPDGVDLPDAIDLYAGDDAGVVAGEIVHLDRDTAKRDIDLRWWVEQPGVPPRVRRSEIDRGTHGITVLELTPESAAVHLPRM